MLKLELPEFLTRYADLGRLLLNTAQFGWDIKDGNLDDPDNLKEIHEFALDQFEFIREYVQLNEVFMLVCGIVGFFSPDDTSDLYAKIVAVAENND